MLTGKKRLSKLWGYLLIAGVGFIPCALVVVKLRSTRNMAFISGKAMSLQDVRYMIEADIPSSASKNQIEKWFKSKSIRYGFLDARKGQLKNEPAIRMSGIAESELSGLLTAVIPGLSGKIIKCHTYIVFVIGKNGKSVNYQVSGACSNPINRLEF